MASQRDVNDAHAVPDIGRRGAWGPPVLTLLLAGLVAVLLEVASSSSELDLKVFPVLALTAGFLVTESLGLDIEVRRHTYTVQFEEVPLVVGLLLTSPWSLVVARALAAILTAVRLRLPLTKAAFNTASTASSTALGVAVFDSIRGTTEGRAALAAAAAALVTAAFQGVWLQVVLVLIRARLAERQLALFAATLLSSTLVSAVLGLLLVVLLQGKSWQQVLIAPVVLVCYLAYRVYSLLLARHQALAALYEMAQSTRTTADRQTTVVELLDRARTLLNADEARIAVPPDEEHREGWTTVRSEQGTRFDQCSSDPVHREVLRTRRAQLILQGDTRLDEWLWARGGKDALVVPLPGEAGTVGTLEVAHRTDRRTFTRADLELLQTLAAHAGFALENSNLLARLRYDASHDHLTGCVNRAGLLPRLTEVVDRRRPAALVLLGLREFKDINEALGHRSGDLVLRAVADRLRAQVPAGATVARLGGDEFAVVLPGVADDEAEAAAKTLLKALAEPVVLEEAVIDVDARVGVAVYPEHGHDAPTLLQRADAALAAAKETDLAVRCYDARLDDGGTRRLAMVSELRRALREDELAVYYQPKVGLRSGELVGVEALVRWHHRVRGEVGPDDFIPLAERSGLITPLTWYVLDQSLAQCRRWLDEGTRIPVAVNISVRALVDPAFARIVQETLERWDVEPAMLTLELTESSMMADRHRSLSTLTELTASGISVSVDDFGTGYSSLSHLRYLPVTEVKIDKSFVRPIATDERDVAVIGAIVQLAHGLGKRAVAEGIEDGTTWRKLAETGCDVGQGYVLSRPLPADLLAVWVRENAQVPPAPLDLRGAERGRSARTLHIVSRA